MTAKVPQFSCSALLGFSCLVRPDSRPDHPSGRALDIMIGSDLGLGDSIIADVLNQKGRFNVQYTMWRVASHFNHVQVTVG